MLPSALAEEPKLADVTTQIGENKVSYPQLEGLGDAAIQQAINDDIILQSDVARHLITLGTLQDGGWGLVVGYEAFLKNNVLSVAMNAKGTMADKREGQAYTALCYDLLTGERLGADEIFADSAAAKAHMEEVVLTSLLDELSPHLENGDLVPLPMNNFAFDEDGITFYYPHDQFSLLSGYSGACQFYWEELEDFLHWEGVLGRLGLRPQPLSESQAKEQIQALLSQGRLPHIPIQIDQEMTPVVEQYRLVRQPDQYPGGKYYQLEDPRFRQIWVLSDALGSGWEHSLVQGLQSTRAYLFGIVTGETSRSRWREILGEPDSTAVFSESMAYDYGIVQGESDFYTFGAYQLRLHADEDNILHSIRLSK